MRILRSSVCAVALVASVVSPAFAWGSAGHRLVSRVAAEHLPASLPAFVRSPDAVAEIEALGPEPDRIKGSGKSADSDGSPGHYLDVRDDDTVEGVVPLAQLPADREDFDTVLRGVHSDQYKMGYLPYSLIDGYELLVTDFAYWRIDDAGAKSATAPADKAYFVADRRLREMLTLRDIGVWSHFVGDASQPLHVSVHFNGWGDYPNPSSYSTSRTIHARFETALVNKVANDQNVSAHLRPYAPSTAPIAARVGAYLAASAAAVPRVYQLEAQGAIDAATPPAADFVEDRLAAGAAMLRDLIADAYAASDAKTVGYPAMLPADVESGKIVPTRAMFGSE